MKFVLCLVAFLVVSPTVLAQTASLRGQVTDQNGAVVTGAQVTVRGAAGLAKTAATDGGGSYVVAGLPPGEYSVEAAAPNLKLLEPIRITLTSGARTLNLELKAVLSTEAVTVDEDGELGVSTDAAANAGAQVLRGDRLDALGDSPEDLAADLLALAGPSAGPDGGQVFVDGFSGGQLPPKNSIREIRINQNPFSPEYDRLGFGRVEILTKPGAGKFGGSVFYNFANQFWNSRNPYAQRKAPFILHEYGGSLSGPLNKRASFFLDVRRDAVDNGSIVNAITLDPQTLAVINPFTATPVTPQRRISVNPRLDYQPDGRNTLVFRYGFIHSRIREAGVGGFNLPSRASEFVNTSHTVQLTETAVLNDSVVNETRFQFLHSRGENIANNSEPALQVLGAFNGGGAPSGHSLSTQSGFELHNTTSIVRGKHLWRFGARARWDRVSSISPQNFNGTFTFGGGDAPVLSSTDFTSCAPPSRPVLAPATSIERYRRSLLFQRLGCSPSQVRALGGGATQFSISAGDPALSASQLDVGAFVSDDWRVRPGLTLNLGLRYEAQSNLSDWRAFAPRLALAWAPGATAQSSPPKTVFRVGFGVFYDRFALANTVTALRYNGVVQRQYVVTNPDFFPAVPPVSSPAGFQTTQTIQRVSPTLRAPYIVQSAASVERQLPFKTTLAITYANARGLHMLRSRDINAPLPGTFDPLVPGSGVFPSGRPGPVFLMESSGLYNQNQLVASVNSTFNKDVSLSASYVLNYARSDTDGLGTFPAKPYDFTGEYGPAATDVRHRVSVNGTISTRWNVRFSPFLIAQSGAPFDITVGRPLYGTTLFNGRPGIPTGATKPGLILTEYGLLDPNPTPDQRTLPRNFGRGPGTILVNLRVAKIIEFGRVERGQTPSGGSRAGATPPARRPYNLSVSLSIRNLINHTNPGPIIGNITSPLFGQANQPSDAGGFVFSEAANNRRLELQMRLTF